MTARKRKLKPAASPTILKLDPDTTLRVQLIESSKATVPVRKWLRLFAWVFVLTALGYGLLMLLYIFPRTHIPSTSFNGIPELSIRLSYPTYLAFGDIGEIDMTVSNHGDTTISGTVIFAFTETMPILTLPAKSTAVTLTELKHGESLSERLSISLNRPFWPRQKEVQFQVLAEAKGRRGVLATSLVIYKAPVPFLRTISAWLPTGSILLSGLLAFFWEVLIKQRLVPKHD